MSTIVTTLAGARSPDNRAAILARKGPLAQHDSTARQLADAPALAAAKARAVSPRRIQAIDDGGIGTNQCLEDHDLMTLLEAVQNTEIKHVVAQHLDRLTRDQVLTTMLLGTLGRFGVTLWCCSTNAFRDLSPAEGLKMAVSAAHGGRVCNGKEA